MGAMLPITVGVGLLSCVCKIVLDQRLPTGNVYVTRKPEVARQPSCMTPRSKQVENISHVKERTWILSWYSGD